MADQLTLADARRVVRELLDDRSAKRWPDSGSPSTIDIALRSAVSGCVDEYVAQGGDRFTEAVLVTTSATTGAVSLSTYDAAAVLAVGADVGTGYAPLQAGDPLTMGETDQVARDLRVQLVRRAAFPTVTTDLLIGAIPGVQRSWPALEMWICASAARMLGSTDDDRRAAVREIHDESRKQALSHARTAKVVPWDDRRIRSPYLALLGRLRWTYDQQARTLALHLSR